MGLYSFPALSPEGDELRVEGLPELTRSGLDLSVADVVTVNFAIELGSVARTITVEGTHASSTPRSSSLAGFVNEQKISDLPPTGRNFIDLGQSLDGRFRNELSNSGM